MTMKGYDVFYTDPDTVEDMLCKVCGTPCEVERSLTGPTGWVEALAKRGHWHDRFQCPHTGKPWHEKALELYKEIEKSASNRVAELMRQDLNDLLKDNL